MKLSVISTILSHRFITAVATNPVCKFETPSLLLSLTVLRSQCHCQMFGPFISHRKLHLKTEPVPNNCQQVHTSTIQCQSLRSAFVQKRMFSNCGESQEMFDHDEDINMTPNQRDKLQRIVNDILERVNKHDRSEGHSYAVTENHLFQVVLMLFRKKIAPAQMVHYLSSFPELLDQPTNAWTKAINVSLDLGFKSSEILPLLAEVPELFGGRSKNIEVAFEVLRTLGFHDRQPYKILLGFPSLVDYPLKKLIYNHQNLLQLFSKSDLAKMILRTPQILVDDPAETVAKFEYAYNVMGIDPKYMNKSDFLCHDLLYLETRHKFLERAGLYETPDKHGATKIENPTFKNIVDTDDRYFAVRVAKMSLAEYKAFIKLYEIEKQELESDFDEDELSSDEEEDFELHDTRT